MKKRENKFKNFIQLEPGVKRRNRAFNNLEKGDKVVVTIGNKTRQTNGATMIEIEPLNIVTEEDRTILMCSMNDKEKAKMADRDFHKRQRETEDKYYSMKKEN